MAIVIVAKISHRQSVEKYLEFVGCCVFSAVGYCPVCDCSVSFGGKV